jgi:hypothetical protein
LFLELHIDNRHETLSSKCNFVGEFTKLVLEQQGCAPRVNNQENREIKESLKSSRKERSQLRKNEAWAKFNDAPNIDAPTATAIQQKMNHGIHVEEEDVQALKKYQFYQFYKCDITRELFEKDSTKFRDRIRLHEQRIFHPHVEALLNNKDLHNIRLIVSQRFTTFADLRLQALPHEMHCSVLRCFGFPVDAGMGICLHDTNMMRVTDRFCERTFVSSQIQYLKNTKRIYYVEGVPTIHMDKQPLKLLSELLKESYGIALQSYKPLKERDKDTKDRIQTSKGLDPDLSIIQQRHPTLVPPNMILRITRQHQQNTRVNITYVLAFSPHHIPAYISCTPDHAAVQSAKYPRISVSQFERKCKLFCPKGILLRLQEMDLYHQYDQYWIIYTDKYVQYTNAQAAITQIPNPKNTKGTLWVLPDDEPPKFYRENRTLITEMDWVKRFVDTQRPLSVIE